MTKIESNSSISNRKGFFPSKNLLGKFIANIPQKPQHDKKSMIFIFHKDWNLVINMMIGINKSIKALWDMHDRVLDDNDFKIRDMFQLNYKRDILDNTAVDKGTCFFYNYAPYVFSEIRHFYGIKDDDVIFFLLVSCFYWI